MHLIQMDIVLWLKMFNEKVIPEQNIFSYIIDKIFNKKDYQNNTSWLTNWISKIIKFKGVIHCWKLDLKPLFTYIWMKKARS